jgi:ATP-dependent RNA helicase DeaD
MNSKSEKNVRKKSIPTVVVVDAETAEIPADQNVAEESHVVEKSLSQEILESASATINAESEVVDEEALPTKAEFIAIRKAEKAARTKPVDTPQPSQSESEPVRETKLAAVNEEKAAELEANKVRFRDLPLSKDVVSAVEKSGYETPTPIQEQIIPHVLEGKDVMAQSQTGSGKTAAFALPILTKIDTKAKAPQALVLAPTRELAIQVSESFERYASQISKFSSVAIYGGQDYEIQFRKLRRGVQVVVGTPGRVIDHINRGTLDLSKLQTLVLDEADEMLNMGFLDDVEYVLDKTPGNRQVTLFSATFNDQIKKIAKRYLTDPVQIKIQRKTITADSIRQRAIVCGNRDKIDLLIQMLEVEETDGILVFTRTKDSTITVADQINRAGFRVAALNGDMPQKTRERTIDRLKNQRLDIVVATDVAARGLDVTRVSHVFNYDFPESSDSYIHRVGRTGRAGRKGEAILFVTPSQRGKLRMVERATKKKIEIVEPPSAKHLNAMRVRKLRDLVSKTISESDLSKFKSLIATHAEESGESMEDIAAALAFIGQRGNEFFSTDRPKRTRRERDDREGRDGREGRGRNSRRRGGPPEEGMARYRIEVGHRDRVKPGNIVGAVTNESGIEGQHIGPIRIYESHSTIDLPSGMPDDVRKILSQTRVMGRELQIREATPKDEIDHGGRGGGGRRSFGGGGRGGRDDRSGGRGGFRGKRDFRGKKSGGRSFAKVKNKKRRD